MTEISCVIPTFNGLKLLQKNLPSVMKALPVGSQLIISDDGSSDQTVEWMCRNFKLKTTRLPQTHISSPSYFPNQNKLKLFAYSNQETQAKQNVELLLIANKDNLRFTGAANLGVAFAKYEYVMLLNNDAAPEKDAFIKLAQVLDSNRDFFAATALEYDSQSKTNASGKNQLWFEMGIFKHSKADNLEYGQNAWASGGSSMFRLKCWRELNGLDKRFYPAYWEDIDLSYRARQKGLQVIFTPTAVIYHQHETTHQSIWAAREMQKISWRNADRFTWKNGNLWQKISFILWRPYWWWQRNRTTASQLML